MAKASVCEKAPGTTLYHVTEKGRPYYVLPAHGYVERIELRPRVDVPNMNLDRTVLLSVELIGGDGSPVPIDVLLIARDVL